MEVEFVEKETEAVVGEEGTRLGVLLYEEWSLPGSLIQRRLLFKK